MEKELNDYLHLYIGCEVELTIDNKSLVKVMTIEDIKRFGGRSDWMKPILRPLSDMSKMEMIKLLSIVYKNIYNYIPDIENCTYYKEGKDSIGMKCVDRLDNSELGFTIEVSRGVEYSTNGNYSIVNQFECTYFLLKNGFDLFGLIELGLVIDKSEYQLLKP